MEVFLNMKCVETHQCAKRILHVVIVENVVIFETSCSVSILLSDVKFNSLCLSMNNVTISSYKNALRSCVSVLDRYILEANFIFEVVLMRS